MENDLNRFIEAQAEIYEQVIKELEQGEKTTHRMWYIFPQAVGLGYTKNSTFYGIKSLREAKNYAEDAILGKRLVECCNKVLNIKGKTAEEIFGTTDAMKLKSSMTLFSAISDNHIFTDVLEKYFDGKKDEATLKIARLA